MLFSLSLLNLYFVACLLDLGAIDIYYVTTPAWNN